MSNEDLQTEIDRLKLEAELALLKGRKANLHSNVRFVDRINKESGYTPNNTYAG